MPKAEEVVDGAAASAAMEKGGDLPKEPVTIQTELELTKVRELTEVCGTLSMAFLPPDGSRTATVALAAGVSCHEQAQALAVLRKAGEDVGTGDLGPQQSHVWCAVLRSLEDAAVDARWARAEQWKSRAASKEQADTGKKEVKVPKQESVRLQLTMDIERCKALEMVEVILLARAVAEGRNRKKGPPP